jgi:aminopeptidase N
MSQEVLMAKSVARLYKSFQPNKYGLALSFDLEQMTFKGTVLIQGKKVGRPSQRLTFHQKDLKITSATVTRHDKNGDQFFEIGRINNQNNLSEVRLHSEAKLFPGDYTISMDFKGKITKPMSGIYPCYFKHGGQDKMLIATQFESHHARNAFPCIDEPEAKATFDLTILSPAGQTVIANTPVKEAEDIVGSELQKTTFQTTPKMSTYLLAFAFGELGYTESKTKSGIVVRSYATPDNVTQTQFSVSYAAKVLDFFGDYFGTPYPLEKLDMLALPDFSAGAMENWGLITYREVAMLYDEATAPIESKQYVAMVVSHEISHQWFGNLVTMKWWNELYPEWRIWELFVSAEGGSARRRDSLGDVQSIHTDVHHPDEISTLFDPSIVYAKGGTVLHMLMNYIGEADFRTGLQAYFKQHAYANTVADDLWKSLSASSGQDVASFMHDWLYRPGYPLVTVDWQPGSTPVGLSQHRFFSDPEATDALAVAWQVPLAANQSLTPALLATEAVTASLPADTTTPLLLNHEGQSYFLPLYKQPAHLSAIVTAITAGKVSTIDRQLLLDNYNLLQRGGEVSLTDLLQLLPAYAAETSDSVWSAIATAIAEVRKLIEADKPSEDKLNEMVQTIIRPTVERVGWEDDPADGAHTLRLRGLALSLAIGAEDPNVLKEAQHRFAGFTKISDLPATSRSVVFYAGARFGTAADFERLLKLHRETTSADEREELAGALTAAKDPARYNQLLVMLTGDEIRRQDLMHWFVWLLRNRYSRSDTWDWLVSHWDWIEQEFNSDKSYSYYMRYAGGTFSYQIELDNYRAFFVPKKSNVALARDIALGEQEITARIAWRKRNEAAVKAWLKDL